VRIYDPESPDSTTIYLEEGDSFNELSFVFNSHTLTTSEAEDFCILDTLSKDSFEEVASQHPELKNNIKSGLKSVKSDHKANIIKTLSEIEFFKEFEIKEIETLYQEYMEVLFLKPDTLVTSPAKESNALYFIVKGDMSRYRKSDTNFDLIKLRVIGEDKPINDEYDSFIQQIDYIEQKKALEESRVDSKLTKGDFLGNLRIDDISQNFFFDITDTFCELVYISIKVTYSLTFRTYRTWRLSSDHLRM
jgi:CRP-like cAMP-binding protein